MSHPKKGTEAYRRERERERERRAKKREEQKAAALDSQTPPENVEVAPETAMQVNLEVTYSNEKQPGQLMSDAAFHDYLDRQNRRK